VEIRTLNGPFGAEVFGFDPRAELDDANRTTLQDAFDHRGLLVFRGIEISKAEQVRISRMLIRKDHETEHEAGPEFEDNFYISNTRPNSAAPFGRLRFHADTMWAEQPFEVLSLYGVEVDEPVVPTTFVSGTHAWATLPPALRARVEGLHAFHTAGEVRRGDMTQVLLPSVENALQHARPNVDNDGPARTLRKVASPIPKLDPDQLPQYTVAK
jgi:alpha-ketoglutarate-dependent taurine dioxygenase